MCDPETERRQAFLYQLKEGPEKVSPELLLNPKSNTRPRVGLVVCYCQIRQVVFADFSFGPVLALLLALVVSSGLWRWIWGLAPILETWINLALSLIPWGIPNILAIQLLSGLIIAVSGCCIIGIAAFLLGKLSITREALAMDLNGLFYHSPKGKTYIPWSQVYASNCWRTRWIRLFREDGGILVCRVPLVDRDWLAQVVRLLILHHQPDLYGKRDSGN